MVLTLEELLFQSKTSLQQLSMRPRALSITSVKFNFDQGRSDYMDYIFGYKALFLHREKYDPKLQSTDIPSLFKEHYRDGLDAMRAVVDEKKYIHPSECSMEVLGTVFMSKYNPFRFGYYDIGPSVGNATLNYHNIGNRGDITSDCIYRGLYENFVRRHPSTGPHYFTTIFYCPIHDKNICNDIQTYVTEQNNPIIDMTISLYLYNGMVRTTSFQTKLRRYFTTVDGIQPKMAICTILPYLTIDKEKREANSAIFITFLQYYLSLGFRVFVYDSWGQTYHQSIKSGHDPIKYIDSTLFNRLVYHNYTIRSLLSPRTTRDLKFDNFEKSLDFSDSLYNNLTWFFRLERSNADKQLTGSHCRFEAQSVYGISQVIVADFDEFLYCPSAGNTYILQKRYINQRIIHHRNNHIEQVSFLQRVLANTTDSIVTCLQNKIRNRKSIFECISAYRFVTERGQIKSFHLKYVCPMTGYHMACSKPEDPFSHDCKCNTDYDAADICAFVHVVTNHKRYYDSFRNLYDMSSLSAIGSEQNEMISVMNSRPVM